MTSHHDRDQAAHLRGVWYALLVVPLTIVVWLFAWQFGIITSVVAWGAAVLAVRMYSSGSGGLPPRRGAVAILIIVLGGVAASLVASFVFDAAKDYYDEAGSSMVLLGRALTDPTFIEWTVNVYAADHDVWAPWLLTLAIAMLFTLLGVAPTLARAFRGAPTGNRVAVFLFPLALVLGVFGLYSFAAVPGSDPHDDSTNLAYVVGDCLPSPEQSAQEGSVEGTRDRPVACDEGHELEVFFAGEDPTAADGPYPSEDYFVQTLGDLCDEAYAAYVGIPIEQSDLSTMFYFPSNSTWTYSGDREIACSVGDPDVLTVGTLKGSAR